MLGICSTRTLLHFIRMPVSIASSYWTVLGIDQRLWTRETRMAQCQNQAETKTMTPMTSARTDEQASTILPDRAGDHTDKQSDRWLKVISKRQWTFERYLTSDSAADSKRQRTWRFG